ncbi:MAG TPA: bifunctional 5,10-methylenetetrahydrofolate dehydrogenase/5,10-methenyltetrahydrofolate cyclohydrolase [Candidatus Dormibacteraeota bacterium]|nr:bifunctional 5,10-methylenetetrahydrofolate dehydrogenase/5,10-methenyltetrahydrofolate cyclohydrolase [Candidatus Dormibacteraeota bacterium]
MTATIIDGRAIAEETENEVAALIASAPGWRPPGLHVVLASDDAGSATYVAGKERKAARLGLRGVVHRPPLETTTDELVDLVTRLDADDDVDAVLVQLPLMPHVASGRVLDAIDPRKDVDGLHPTTFGLLAEGRPLVTPCTPAGCMELIRRAGVEVRGSRAVVVGRSSLVGRPMALLLVNADATVTVCHSRTRDLPGVCREADILVAATGRPGMVTGDFVKPGACVVDVGISRVDGKLRGDVDRASVMPVAGALTPVPGGVGPMTIAMLMRNALSLAVARRPEGAPSLPWR